MEEGDNWGRKGKGKVKEHIEDPWAWAMRWGLTVGAWEQGAGWVG